MSEINLREYCKKCGAACCRHVALEIDRPTCKRDYDNIRWYLMHKDVNVFIDSDSEWYIKFSADCENINKDGDCAIYKQRPKICREYPGDDNNCEFVGEDEYYEELFTNARDFEKYLEGKNVDWRWKKL